MARLLVDKNDDDYYTAGPWTRRPPELNSLASQTILCDPSDGNGGRIWNSRRSRKSLGLTGSLTTTTTTTGTTTLISSSVVTDSGNGKVPLPKITAAPADLPTPPGLHHHRTLHKNNTNGKKSRHTSINLISTSKRNSASSPLSATMQDGPTSPTFMPEHLLFRSASASLPSSPHAAQFFPSKLHEHDAETTTTTTTATTTTTINNNNSFKERRKSAHAKPYKIRPLLQKMSQDKMPTIDLSRSFAEHEGLDFYASTELIAPPMSRTSSGPFGAHLHHHARNMSVTSQASSNHSSIGPKYGQHATFTHPLRPTPRTFSMPVTAAADNDADDVCDSVFGGAHSSDNLWTVDAAAAAALDNSDKIVDDAQSARASETHTPSPARTSFSGSDLRRPHFKNPFDSPTSPRFPPTSATSMTFASGGAAGGSGTAASEAASSLHSTHWPSTPGMGTVVSAADFCTSTSSIFSQGTSQPATAQTSVDNSRPSSASVTYPRLFPKSTSRSRSNTAATSTSNSGGSIYAGSAESSSNLTAAVAPTSAAAAPTSNATGAADKETQQAASVAALRAKFQEKEAAKAAKHRAAEIKAQQKEQRKQDRKLSIAVGGNTAGGDIGTPVASPPSSPRFFRRAPSSPQSATETWSNHSDTAATAAAAAAPVPGPRVKRDSLPANTHRKSSCALHPFRKESILLHSPTAALLTPGTRRGEETRTSSVSSSSTIAIPAAATSPLVATAPVSPASYTRPVLPTFTSTSASRPGLPVFGSGSSKSTKPAPPPAPAATSSEQQGKQSQRSTLRRIMAAIARFFRLLGGRREKSDSTTSTVTEKESDKTSAV